ncbi:MAG: chemotaxis response regulator protein-glutamate methylesterase [Oscillospiraceae bacterium]|nr:chemotaxis response regulator protein-glutamate methylesterase [Oscillospiraceae bacterium]
MNRIKLLVVDDSILFREVLSRYVQSDDIIEVVGKAGDAYSARDMILKYEPDVMTLDIEMPKMDGVAFLKKLLPQYYIPTIVVSSSEKQKADCINAGAVEFLTKPANRTNKDMETFAGNLCAAVRRAYKNSNTENDPKTDSSKPAQSPASSASKTSSAVKQPENESVKSSQKHSKLKKSEAIIALGASTGGTEALIQVVKEFPADTPPVIIVQHMPAGFTKMYAERLDRICKMDVKEAEDGDRLRSGLIILGAGDFHLRLEKDSKGYYVSSKHGERVSGHCPSVDVLFNSVAETAGPHAIGAIFTGMGRDGADGLLKMRKAGAFTIGQDKSTCVVYGMPMEAYNIGAVEVQAPLGEIARIILNNLY